MDELQKLYDVLVREGYFTKSFDEFKNKWQDESYKSKVYNVVSRDGFYTKDENSFYEKYNSSAIEQPETKSVIQPETAKKKEGGFGQLFSQPLEQIKEAEELVSQSDQYSSVSPQDKRGFPVTPLTDEYGIPLKDLQQMGSVTQSSTVIEKPVNKIEADKKAVIYEKKIKKEAAENLLNWRETESRKIQEEEKAKEEEARLRNEALGISKTPDFVNKLNKIDNSLFYNNELIDNLNDDFSQYGIVITKGGIFNNKIIARTEDGKKTIDIDLTPDSEADMVSESEKLRKFISENNRVTKEEDFLSAALRARNMRSSARINDDGSTSTVKFVSFDNKVIPTLFPLVPGLNSTSKDAWMELPFEQALKVAKERGEVFTFKTDKEAQDFASGAWKDVSKVDIEGDKFYKDRGRDYITEKRRWERYDELDDMIDFFEGYDTENKEQMMKEYPEMFVNGKPRYDIKEVVSEMKKERDLLRPLVKDISFLKQEGTSEWTRMDFDVHLAKKQQETAKEATKIFRNAQTDLSIVNAESLKAFGVTIDQLAKKDKSQIADPATYESLMQKYMDATQLAKTAGAKYDEAKTYFDAKTNKEINNEFVENAQAAWNGFNDGLNNGLIGDQLAAFLLPDYNPYSKFKDKKNASDYISNKLSNLSNTQSRVMTRFAQTRGMIDRDWWDAFLDDPFEAMAVGAASSISLMLPIGSQIIPLTTVTGGLTGAAIGAATTAPAGGSGVLPGYLTGLSKGFATGQAVTGYMTEWTTAIMDAVKNNGYDPLDPRSLETALNDQRVWDEGRNVGAARGIPIAVVDFLTGSMAGRIFKPASKLASVSEKIAKGTVENVVIDPTAEAAGEYIAQQSEIFFGTGRNALDWNEIALEGVGSMGTNLPNYVLNTYQDTKKNTDIDLAYNLTDIKKLASERVSDERISNWANNMEKLGKIDASVNQRIQENIGLRRDAKEVLSVGSKGAGSNTAVTSRTMELLAAKKELTATNNRQEVYSAEIKAINEELSTIGKTKKIPAKEQQVNLNEILDIPEAQREGVGEYMIDGRRYTKEQFLDKIKTFTPERFKRSKVAVKGDIETGQLFKELYNKVKEEIELPEEETNQQQNAIQEQTTSQVSVQPEAGVGEAMVQGEPQTGPQVTPEQTIITPQKNKRKEELTTALAEAPSGATTITIGDETMDRNEAQNELNTIFENEKTTPSTETTPTPSTETTPTPSNKPTNKGDKYTDFKGVERVWGEDSEADKVYEIQYIMSNLASGVGEASANKIKEYADRIISGNQTREQVIQGLPKSFVDGVDQLLAAQQPTTGVTPTTEAKVEFTEQDRSRKAELEEAMKNADKRRKNITVGDVSIPKADVKAELDALNQKEKASQQPAPATEATPAETAPVERTPEQEADLLEELMTGKKKEPVVTETATEVNEESPALKENDKKILEDNGFKESDGMMVNTEGLRAWSKLSDAIKNLLKKYGIYYIEGYVDFSHLKGGETQHGQLVKLKKGDANGIKVNVSSVGDKLNIENTILHELGHKVYRDNLTDAQRKSLEREPITEHGKEVKKNVEEGGKTYKKEDIAEEDFSELFAEYKGDLVLILQLIENQGSTTQPTTKEKGKEKVKEKKEATANEKTAKRLRDKKIRGAMSAIDFGITQTLYNGALEFMARQVEKGTKIGNAIANTMKWIDDRMDGKKWNKGAFGKYMNDTYKVTLGDGREVEVLRDDSKETAEVINGWYQPIEQKILDTKEDKLPANKWAERLRSKEDEDLWTGVREYLEGKGNESVSKKDLLDFMKNNRVEIGKVVESSYEKYQLPGEKSDYKVILVTMPRKFQYPEEDYIIKSRKEYIKDKSNYTIKEIPEKPGWNKGWWIEGKRGEGKFIESDYFIKTAEDALDLYIEETLDLGYGDTWDFYNKNGEYFNTIVADSKEESIEKYKEENKKEIGGFKSSHFGSQANVLVHLRMNTRTDADGNKVLFLEEVQSDWGQEGKREGFETPSDRKKYEEFEKDREDYNRLLDEAKEEGNKLNQDKEFKNIVELFKSSGYFIGTNFKGDGKSYVYKETERGPRDQAELKENEIPSEIKKAFDLRNKKTEKLNKIKNQINLYEEKYGTKYDPYDNITYLKSPDVTISDIPAAPFVMDTNSWVKLGLKVALREAVAQGADKIAWTTGEQQNARYDLSKQIEKISYDKSDNTITAWNKDGKQVIQQTAKESELPNIIGKDVSDKLLNQKEDEEGVVELSGQDIKVGGKGMKGFYGSSQEGTKGIVGGVAEKLFGQKAGEVNIEGNTQSSIDVTPELKAEVEKGLPMFENLKLSDMVRNLQIKTKGLQSNILGVPIAIWNAGVLTAAKAIDAGIAIKDAISKGLKNIKDNYSGKFNEKLAEKKMLISMYSEPIKMAREAGIGNDGIKLYLERKGLSEDQIDTLLKYKERAEKKAPSADKIVGKPAPKKVVVDDYKQLKREINLVNKSIKEGRKTVRDAVKEMVRLFKKSKAITNLTRSDLNKIIGLMDKVYDEASLQKAVGQMFDIILKSNEDIVEISNKKRLAQLSKAFYKGVRETKKDLKAKRAMLTEQIKKMSADGVISLAKANIIIDKINKVNLDNPDMVQRVLDYIGKVFDDADYDNKLTNANKLRSQIKQLSKNKEKFGNLTSFAAKFAQIDPSMVSDIDQYIAMAIDVKEGVSGSKFTPTGVKPASMLDINEANKYLEKTLEEQAETIKKRTADKIENLIGVDVSDLTYEKMLNLLDLIKSEELATGKEKENLSTQIDDFFGKNKDKENAIREVLNKMFDTYASIIDHMFRTGLDPFADPTLPADKLDFKKSDMKLVREFMNMDLSLLSRKEALKAIDALNNFIVNNSTANMASVLAEYNGKKNAKTALSKGLKALTLRLYFNAFIGRNYSYQFASVPLFFEKLFKGANKGAEVQNLMGITSLINHKAEAEKLANSITTEYLHEFNKKKPNNKKFLSLYNIIERGIIADLSKTINGTESQIADEFFRRKQLIQETIEILNKSGSKKEIQLAKTIQEVFDKIAKDAKTIEDVNKKADQINIDAVQFWINKWEGLYDQFADVALNVYNRVLDKSVNFTPDRFSFLERSVEVKGEESLNASSFFSNSNTNNFYKKEAGSLMKSNPPTTLKKDGKANMYVNLSFDTNNANALMEALIDIKTASDIRQIQAFTETQEFEELLPNASDARALKERINILIRNIRGKSQYVDPSFKQMIKKIDRIATWGAGLALGGPSQMPKQTISVAMATLSNAGRLNLNAISDKNINDFINNSGRAIANRGFDAVSELQSLNQKLEQAVDYPPAQLAKAIEDVNKFYLKIFLVNFDSMIARASWISYYEQSLKKQGLYNTVLPDGSLKKGIDYSSHEINQKAADYAQMMVDRQQNISDKDLAGAFFTADNPVKQFIVKTAFPFASFRMNQTMRFMNDITVISSKSASREDKILALRSFAGFAAEMATFRAISFGLSWGYYMMAQAIRGKEEDEEKRKKRWNNLVKGNVTSTVTDVFSPAPPVDFITKYAFNSMLDQMQYLVNIDPDDRYSIFTEEKASLAKSYGMYGIALDKFVKLAEVYQLAATGKHIDSFGNEKYITEEDRNLLYGSAVVLLLVDLGLLPAPELSGVINNIVKTSTSEAKTKNQLQKEQTAKPSKPFMGMPEKEFKEKYPNEWRENYGPGTEYYQNKIIMERENKALEKEMENEIKEMKREMDMIQKEMDRESKYQ